MYIFIFYSATNVKRGRKVPSSTITRALESDTSSRADGSPGSVISQPTFIYPGNWK